MDVEFNYGCPNSLREELGANKKRRHSFGEASDEIEEFYDGEASEPRFYHGFEGGLMLARHEGSVVVAYFERDSDERLEDLGLISPMEALEKGVEVSTPEEAERAVEHFFNYDMEKRKELENQDYLV